MLGDLNPGLGHHPITPHVLAASEEAIQEIQAVAGAGLSPVDIKLRQGLLATRADIQGYVVNPGYVDEEGRDQKEVKEALIHEYAHAIETNNPRLLKAAEDFVEYRCAGEKPTNLADLDPAYGGFLTRWFPTFFHAEFGRKDEFGKAFGDDPVAPYYVGKVYKIFGRVQATEVFSMGLEQMLKDPVAFVEADPEYAHFLLGALQP